jgi:hypothetical protein
MFQSFLIALKKLSTPVSKVAHASPMPVTLEASETRRWTRVPIGRSFSLASKLSANHCGGVIA